MLCLSARSLPGRYVPKICRDQWQRFTGDSSLEITACLCKHSRVTRLHKSWKRGFSSHSLDSLVNFYITTISTCPLFPSFRALEPVNKFIALHLCSFIRTFNLHFLPFNQFPFLFFNRHQTSFKLIRTDENSERYFVFLSSCELG